MGMRRIVRFQESLLKETGQRFGLTLCETTILAFLYNNPEYDTAADIVQLRMLSKGNVSSAVESLLQKNLLEKHQDVSDRRVYHLSLTETAAPVSDAIKEVNAAIERKVFQGISPEERAMIESVNVRISRNMNTLNETKNEAERKGICKK